MVANVKVSFLVTQKRWSVAQQCVDNKSVILYPENKFPEYLRQIEFHS